VTWTAIDCGVVQLRSEVRRRACLAVVDVDVVDNVDGGCDSDGKYSMKK
jgi:hypothetical protein